MKTLPVAILAALTLSCETVEPEPVPGSVEGSVEYCWNANCHPWEWGGEAILTGIGPPVNSTFLIGTFTFTSIPPGRYSVLVDSSITLRLSSLVCVPKFSPKQVEVLEAQAARVVVQAQLACR